MLIIDKNKFSINSKSEILDEDGNVQYWSQPDFSYKERLHVYDNNNNEIGYVQYKILRTQDDVKYFDNKDNELNFNDFTIVGQGWNCEIKNNNSIVLKSVEKDNIVEIEIKESICLLALFGLIK